MSNYIVPLSLSEANAFVQAHHRHHRPVVGHKFSLGYVIDSTLHGVAIVGRPVARHLDDGQTLEVTRTATDGTRNANSLLYGSAWRAARAMGYSRLITYTQEGESGASLRGAGWRVVASRPPRPGWHTPSRPRENHNDRVQRTLWQAPTREDQS